MFLYTIPVPPAAFHLPIVSSLSSIRISVGDNCDLTSCFQRTKYTSCTDSEFRIEKSYLFKFLFLSLHQLLTENKVLNTKFYQSFLVLSPDLPCCAVARVIEQCCFNSTPDPSNGQTANFTLNPPKVIKSTTYVKPIWSAT